jgi:hypothetical protein
MLQMFHLFVSKVDRVLHVLQCALVASGQRPAAAAWCCYQGAAVVHMRAQDGRGRHGAAAGAPSWFTCGCGARGSRRWRTMRCEQASCVGAELCPDERCLQSRIWCGANGIACVECGCRSCIRTDASFRTSGH